MAMETPITVIERHFDTELSAESLDMLAGLPYDRWHEFAVEYKRYADAFADINRGHFKLNDDEVAPYLFEYLKYSPGLGIPIKDTQVVRAEEAIGALKRLLLYHHRVFIPDWFLWLLDFQRFPANEEQKRRSDLSRTLGYLKVILATKSLFDSGILNMIPTEALIEAPVRNHIDYKRDTEWTEAAASDLKIPVAVFRQLLNKLLGYQLNTIDLGVDVIFPTTTEERIFASSVNTAVRGVKAQPAPVLHFLEKLPMPGLEKIRIEDLIRIRTNDDAFRSWRDELIQIYAIARREQATLEERPEEFAAEMAARLRAKRTGIIKGVQEQGFPENTKQGSVMLGFGMMGIAAAEFLMPTGSLAAQLLGAFFGGSSPILAQYIGHKLGTPKRESLVRIYSIFEGK